MYLKQSETNMCAQVNKYIYIGVHVILTQTCTYKTTVKSTFFNQISKLVSFGTAIIKYQLRFFDTIKAKGESR